MAFAQGTHTRTPSVSWPSAPQGRLWARSVLHPALPSGQPRWLSGMEVTGTVSPALHSRLWMSLGTTDYWRLSQVFSFWPNIPLKCPSNYTIREFPSLSTMSFESCGNEQTFVNKSVYTPQLQGNLSCDSVTPVDTHTVDNLHQMQTKHSSTLAWVKHFHCPTFECLYTPLFLSLSPSRHWTIKVFHLG